MFPPYVNTDPNVLLNMDPPRHSRIKRLAGPFFSPLHIAKLTHFVQSVIDDLLDAMEAKGPPFDFVDGYSNILPVRALAHILGVPNGEAFEFKEYAEASVRIGISDGERKRNSDLLAAFVLRLVAERRARPSDDLLCGLVNARDEGDALTEEELLRLAESLWLGGFKTTLWQLGSTVFTLMTHRDHWQELLGDAQLMSPALNELWRWIPSFKPGSVFPRYATTDVELSDGTIVRAGEPVLPEFVIANRDERAFPDASKLDFHRQKPLPHLSFGNGAHVCIGQHLAKLQIRLTLESLLRRSRRCNSLCRLKRCDGIPPPSCARFHPCR